MVIAAVKWLYGKIVCEMTHNVLSGMLNLLKLTYLYVIADCADIQFQSTVHATSAADRVVVQHNFSYECYNASLHHRRLPAHKHIRLQDSTLCLSRPLESEWFILCACLWKHWIWSHFLSVFRNYKYQLPYVINAGFVWLADSCNSLGYTVIVFQVLCCNI